MLARHPLSGVVVGIQPEQSLWNSSYHKVAFWSLIWITEEKAMAPHSSTLAWKIPWTEEPGRLQSMGSLESDTTE